MRHGNPPRCRREKIAVRDSGRRIPPETLLREREVFAGEVAGKLNKQIAVELGTAERTVKAHRAQVMEKMHVTSVAELVRVSDQLREDRIRS